MSLLQPGSDRAQDLFSDERMIAVMCEVEEAWLEVLVRQGIAPDSARADLESLVEPYHRESLEQETEGVGNPAGALVTLLRGGLDGEAARWLHRGLTSQDLLDTALMVELANARSLVLDSLGAQGRSLAGLVGEHRDTPMVGRTLTQYAVPVTFGLVAAHWLSGVLDALEDVQAVHTPVQLGGAAGTMAAAVELGLDPATARSELAELLELDDAAAWHTNRRAITRFGDALVGCTDAWGHLAHDVLALGRPEVGEVVDTSAGDSSTMPGKANPVLAVLVRGAAMTTPGLAATLHAAAAAQVDQRADGAWHAEWHTLADLARRTVIAGSQASDLITVLEVHPDRMLAHLEEADARAEQRVMAELAGHDPTGEYLGEAGTVVDAVLARAGSVLQDSP